MNDLVTAASTPDRLPEALTRWLADGISGGMPSRFIVEHPGTRLCIQLLYRETNSVCLLLERKPQIHPRSVACSALTDRQIEVLSWVARGKTNAEMVKS